jgi:hypothetical protein
VMVEFDPSVLQASSASSTTLTGFTFFIDNTAGTVTTASAAFPSDVLGAGDELAGDDHRRHAERCGRGRVRRSGGSRASHPAGFAALRHGPGPGDHRRAGRHRL